MIFKHQKILLVLEFIAVIAVTIYSGGYALNAPAQVAAETVVETEVESTVKESKEESETKKSETKAESEMVKKVAENKDKSDKKDNTSSGNKTDKNSAAPASGTASKSAANTSTQPSGSNNSHPAENGSSTPASSGGASSAPVNNPKPVTPSPSAPQTQAHTHNWVEKTRTVHHEATGHYEDVVVQEAWDEPIYGMVEVHICAECGEIDSSIDPNLHLGQTGHSNWWSEWKSVQIDSIHHDAVTESKWVEDSAAWDETVSDGYTCSGCGATK
ncbi:hypothetical protein [Frisingicoccus sp.]|uniref:hypothetical protein n=1 Tax=Frisingicoccus sp. TaxID=1918627 RepID=UPI003AB1A539